MQTAHTDRARLQLAIESSAENRRAAYAAAAKGTDLRSIETMLAYFRGQAICDKFARAALDRLGGLAAAW